MSSTDQKQHPKEAHPLQPPFPKQTQDFPGIEAKMVPKPDYGEKSYKGLNRLKDQVAIVTGGDSGIGRAVCLAFAREGAHIVCSYYNEQEDAEETKKVVEESGRECLLIPGDICEEDVCKKIIDDTMKRFGKLDILVNNAAFQGKDTQDITKLDHERVLRTFKTNIVSMFSFARFAVPHMKPGSCFINTASIQAYNPSHGILDYATTKAAIVAFTKGLAQQLIEKGIRVNAVAPGPVWTPLIVQSFDQDHVSEFGQNSPMGRPAQPSELASSYVFLACEEARYVNGEVLGVTGGKGFLG